MRRTVLIALIAALAGCDDSRSPNDVKAVASVTPNEAEPLQPTEFAVTVVNTSEHTRYITNGCNAWFEVHDAAGKKVGPPQWICTLEGGSWDVELSPGESFSFTETWHLGPYSSASNVGELQPGTYVVTPAVMVDGARTTQVTTATLTVREKQ